LPALRVCPVRRAGRRWPGSVDSRSGRAPERGMVEA
jgi:hypothetical protein